jgi:hypothetical protein
VLKIAYFEVFDDNMKFELCLTTVLLATIRSLHTTKGYLDDLNSHLGQNHRNALQVTPDSFSTILTCQRLLARRQAIDGHRATLEGSGNKWHIYGKTSHRHQPF